MTRCPLPTLDQLNDSNSAGLTTLVLFRCLCTSDLTFHYALFKKETLVDLLRVGQGLVDADQESLTQPELAEFRGYCKQLQDEINL